MSPINQCVACHGKGSRVKIFCGKLDGRNKFSLEDLDFNRYIILIFAKVFDNYLVNVLNIFGKVHNG